MTISEPTPVLICPKCGKVGPPGEFTRFRAARRSRCKTCDNTNQREKRYARLGERRAIGETETYRCSACQQTLERKVTPGSRKRTCDPCIKQAALERARLNYKRHDLKRKYGITLEEYEARVVAQGGRCAVCGSKKPGGRHGSAFCVDHDHVTGQVRGLLCDACNRGIGLLKDNPKVLAKAARYVQQHRQLALISR